MQMYSCSVRRHRSREARAILLIRLLSIPVFRRQAAVANDAQTELLDKQRLGPRIVQFPADRGQLDCGRDFNGLLSRESRHG